MSVVCVVCVCVRVCDVNVHMQGVAGGGLGVRGRGVGGWWRYGVVVVVLAVGTRVCGGVWGGWGGGGWGMCVRGGVGCMLMGGRWGGRDHGRCRGLVCVLLYGVQCACDMVLLV